MTAVAELYRVSPAQEGMLFHSRTSPIDGCYVELTTFRIRGELDLTALTGAWRAALARHPVLRTGFAWEGIRTPHQVVVTEAEPRIDFADLTGRPAGERSAFLDAEVARRRSERFDLTKPPLMRLLVVRCPGEHLLVWTYHHLLLDGWSAALLLGEVTNALAGVPPGPVPPPYRDYVQWVLRRPPGPAREFWTSYLAGFRPPAAPAPAGPAAGRYRSVRLSIPPDRTAALREAAARHRATLSELFESAWGVVLGRFSGRDDVVFGVATAGRPPELPGAGEMVGMFVTTVPVRVKTPPRAPVSGFLREFLAGRRRMLDHQYLPLPEIQACSAVPAGTALFDSLVAFENYPERALPQDGPVSVSDVRYETRTNYRLTLVIRIGEELTVQAVADEGRFAAGEPEQLLHYLDTVLTRLGTRSPATVREVGALPEDTARRMAELNAGEPGPEISVLLARHARETPDAPALVAPTEVVSYRELDRRVSAFARGLRERGVGSGDRVDCRIGGTVDRVTALLAVDRAGACWAPPGAGPAFVITDDLVARPVATPDGAADRHPLSVQPAALARRVGLGRTDVVLCQGEPAPAELLAAVAAGAAIVGAPALTGREPDEWTARFGVTTLLADPSRLAPADGTSGGPAGLRVICTGALPSEPVRRADELWWLYRHPGTGLCLTATAYDPGDPDRAGSPLAGIRPVVLDDAGEPVPWGVPGALWLDGEPRVATGERARLRPDGRLEIAVAPGESGAGESGAGGEAVVLRLFREVLGADGAGAGDDFFDLGGDSAAAVRLAGLVRSAFGGEPDPELVFDFPTASALAGAIARRRGTETRRSPIPAKKE